MFLAAFQFDIVCLPCVRPKCYPSPMERDAEVHRGVFATFF